MRSLETPNLREGTVGARGVRGDVGVRIGWTGGIRNHRRRRKILWLAELAELALPDSRSLGSQSQNRGLIALSNGKLPIRDQEQLKRVRVPD